MALRASSAGSGRTTRSSSVCQSRSMISASRRSWRRPVGRSCRAASSSSAIRRSLLSTRRRAASVGCAVKTGRTLRLRTRRAQVLGVGVLEPVGGAGEQAALGGAAGAQLAAAVHLLGDVGQVEVGGEGADQLGGGLQVGLAEQCGGGLAVAAGQGADLLDEVEEFLALLADQGLAEQFAQAADVGAQGGVVGAGRSSGVVVGDCSQVRLLAIPIGRCEGTACGADRAVRRDQDRSSVVGRGRGRVADDRPLRVAGMTRDGGCRGCRGAGEGGRLGAVVVVAGGAAWCSTCP